MSDGSSSVRRVNDRKVTVSELVPPSQESTLRDQQAFSEVSSSSRLARVRKLSEASNSSREEDDVFKQRRSQVVCGKRRSLGPLFGPADVAVQLNRGRTSFAVDDMQGISSLGTSSGSTAGFAQSKVSEGAGWRLERRQQPQKMSSETLAKIRDAITEHSVSLFLEASDVDIIANAMEYYFFKAGEIVVNEGELETHFMVTLDANIQVDLGGGQFEEVPCGAAFGSSSLVCGRARTSTVRTNVDCGIWAADGALFRQILRETASRRSAVNLRLLENIDLFKVFSVRHLEVMSRVLQVEHFAEGSVIVDKGSCDKAIDDSCQPTLKSLVSESSHNQSAGQEATLWCLKQGSLRAVDPDTGKEIRKFLVGESFGEQGLLYREGSPWTVYAAEDSELLCISSSRLKPLLGKAVLEFVQEHIISTALRSGPVCAHYSKTQRAVIAQHFSFRQLKPQERLGDGFIFIAVVTGEISAASSKQPHERTTFSRGQFHSFLTEFMQVSASDSRLHDFVAGPDGASVGILTQMSLTKALGVGELGVDEASRYTRKIMVLKRVPLFRHLSQDQISKLVDSFVQSSKGKDEFIIEQGSCGGSFYVLVRGEVSVTIGSKLIRTMGRNAYFGERALIFDERRTASVRVSSDDGVELWSVDKSAFDSVITENMRQELMHRIRLQDTEAKLGDLKVVQVIGRGASGVVRLVEHRKTGTRYALKFVDKTNEAMVQEVREECDLLRENDHPFIMNVVTTYETMRRVYMLTELVTGGDLHAAIRKIPHCLTRKQAAFYTASLVVVLEALWDRNIVYRDLKPENVMIDMQGYIKLIDFGVAKKVDNEGRAFTTIGTPHYMAPEVMSSTGYSCGCDLWSLGVMLYEFVIGHLPFGDDLSKPADVFAAVLAGKLQFPGRYKDEDGKQLMTGLLSFNPATRLGTSMRGYEDVRRASYFHASQADDHDTYFNQIMGREVDAPYLPEAETYLSDDESEFSDKDSRVTDVSDELDDDMIGDGMIWRPSVVSTGSALTSCTSSMLMEGIRSVWTDPGPEKAIMQKTTTSATTTAKGDSSCCSCLSFLKHSAA